MRRRYVNSEGGRGPRHRRWQKLREHPRRGIFLLPSLLTTGNLFCGFLALLLSAESRFTEASIAIFVAMVMDTLDGKVARLTKTTTQFGVEFDSMDGQPTYLFFVLVAPESSTGAHLKALARISRVFKDPEFRRRLLAAPDAELMYHVVADEDAKY